MKKTVKIYHSSDFLKDGECSETTEELLDVIWGHTPHRLKQNPKIKDNLETIVTRSKDNRSST